MTERQTEAHTETPVSTFKLEKNKLLFSDTLFEHINIALGGTLKKVNKRLVLGDWQFETKGGLLYVTFDHKINPLVGMQRSTVEFHTITDGFSRVDAHIHNASTVIIGAQEVTFEADTSRTINSLSVSQEGAINFSSKPK